MKQLSQIDPHHLPKNINTSDRAKTFPGQLHESDGKLFCDDNFLHTLLLLAVVIIYDEDNNVQIIFV